MKNILILIALILSSCQTKSKEITVENTVTNSFKKVESLVKVTEIDAPEIKMLEYLSVKYNRIQDSTFLKKPDWMLANDTEDEFCGYIISFKEGHSFKHQQECNEWGEIVTVNFSNFSAAQVRDIVEELFENDYYDWYADETEYRPKESYETVWSFRIIEKEKSIDLEFAYSWI